MIKEEVSVPSIRGAYLNPSKAWICKTYGQEVFQVGVSPLPKERQSAYLGVIVSVAWYPLSEWEQILGRVRAEVAKRTGESGETFDRRNVWESGGMAMRLIYRVVFNMMDPVALVNKAIPLLQRVYSHGQFEVVKNVPGECSLRFSNAPASMLPELKRTFPLAIAWMLDTGGQEVTSQSLTPTVKGGTFSCDFEARYRKR